MALELKKPSQLPAAPSVTNSAVMPVDNGVAVQKATPKQIVDAGRPVASEAQAIAGTDNETAMTPLTTKQAMDAGGAGAVALSQAWAESPTSPDGGPSSKSSKTWAGESSVSAAAALASEDAVGVNAAIATAKAAEADASAAAALVSKDAATTSAAAATTKASEAVVSAADALSSKNSAAASATTSTTKAGEASTSAADALASKNAAAASATTSTTKAAEASTSASDALASKNAASTSATNAATSAATSATKAGEASTSAAAALASKNASDTNAATATTKAGEAAASAADALVSKNAAASSATTATTKAGEASSSAAAALVSKTAAEAAAGSDRAAMVTRLAGGFVPTNGVTYHLDGVEYLGKTGSTVIPDLPGLIWSTVITPMHFGALGNDNGSGSGADDGVAINAAIAAYKVVIEAAGNSLGSLDFSGLGRIYRSTISINATGISSWGWSFRDMTIFSQAAGKNGLDMIGSRGGFMDQVMVYGDKASMPRVGIMQARGSIEGPDNFAAGIVMTQCRTMGYFSLTGLYAYGAEGNKRYGCEWWNRQFDAHCAIYTGEDIYPVESDYLAASTGPTSMIFNLDSGAEIRYFPESAAITSMTLANPLVMAVAATTTFAIGQKVTLQADNLKNVGGQAVESLLGEVTATGAGTITFGAIDASTWGAFTAGRAYRANTAPPLVICRSLGHTFETPYVVSFGSTLIDIRAPSTGPIASVSVKIKSACMEAYGNPSYVNFTTYGASLNVDYFEFSGYQGRATDAYFTHTRTGLEIVRIRASKLSIASRLTGYGAMFDNEASFSLFNTSLVVPWESMISPTLFANFVGDILYLNSSKVEIWGGSAKRFGTEQKFPVTGTSVKTEYGDNAGLVKAYQEYDATNNRFLTSFDGVSPNFIHNSSAFRPVVDASADLGLASARWNSIFAANLRAMNVYSHGGSFGYASGDAIGGTITQGTDKTTSVTLDKRTGTVTTAATALGASSRAIFRLNNSTIPSTGLVLLNLKSPTSKYRTSIVGQAAGYVDIELTNFTAGSLSEAVVLSFMVLDGAVN